MLPAEIFWKLCVNFQCPLSSHSFSFELRRRDEVCFARSSLFLAPDAAIEIKYSYACSRKEGKACP